MATSKVKLPKIGDYVSVVWIDSGVGYFRECIEPKDMGFTTFEDIGKVVAVSAEMLVLGHSIDVKGCDAHSDTYSAIWVPSIQKVRVFR